MPVPARKAMKKTELKMRPRASAPASAPISADQWLQPMPAIIIGSGAR